MAIRLFPEATPWSRYKDVDLPLQGFHYKDRVFSFVSIMEILLPRKAAVIFK